MRLSPAPARPVDRDHARNLLASGMAIEIELPVAVLIHERTFRNGPSLNTKLDLTTADPPLTRPLSCHTR